MNLRVLADSVDEYTIQFLIKFTFIIINWLLIVSYIYIYYIKYHGFRSERKVVDKFPYPQTLINITRKFIFFSASYICMIDTVIITIIKTYSHVV